MSVTERSVVRDEYHQSVEEAIWEAMSTPQQRHVEPTRGLPQPHLPLRKASASRLRSKYAPKPILGSSHHIVRGFQPRTVEASTPQIDTLTASSEHAFAARDARRPSQLPLGSLALQHGQHAHSPLYGPRSSSIPNGDMSRPPSSPLLPPPTPPMDKQKVLRGSKSLGEGLRGWKRRLSNSTGAIRDSRDTSDSVAPPSSLGTDDVRQSFRSALTSHSSYLNTSSIQTDCSSLATGNSSHSEFVNVYPNCPGTDEAEDGVTTEDVIGMYAEGFESAKESMDTYGKRSFQHDQPKNSTDTYGRHSFESLRPSMDASGQRLSDMGRPASAEDAQTKAKRPYAHHRRSQSASLLLHGKPSAEASFAVPHPGRIMSPSMDSQRGDTRELDSAQKPTVQALTHEPVPRDRYGFKKASHYITVQQYDAWDVHYSEHLKRRSKKWHLLMKSYGLSTDKPYRFPPKSDKITRYVRKGIAPEFRGAAWFWYGGGHVRLSKNTGLYQRLLRDVDNGRLGDNDREHIERDLNRTFPDNVRFKPDPTVMSDAQAGAGGGKKRGFNAEPETPIIKALRRVLQAFAVHNPSIGYCQSLNFIAGLLLLFLDEDEEKAFTLLEIVTSEHLPGTHGVALEGANIDIAVLMSLIKEYMEPVWRKLDDKGGGLAGDPTAQTLRLPTVSLATTAWFMSLFVGTLPIEAVLRVWDCLFFEGSKTLFRVALAIFRAGERQILSVSDPMEIFQVVQTIPRAMLDVNTLMEVSFGGRRKGGFGSVSQKEIDRRRLERRQEVKDGVSHLHESAVSRWRGRWRSKTKV
ncbi:hypothetical protein M433DRAFT_155647 [Acidomyces richmondensis BFW]|nr:MAG: hypothetical protein FE78DRAFT_91611 [Acidomyces sp. 'richmondensis']KYG44404.1 hypothetical protein M433DRAFT_155647 [Acidomyces richmondensis BFW]